MSKIPEHIVLVVCKSSNNNTLEILKEYFNSIPHIKYTHCKLDSKDICYILPCNRVICNILNYIGTLPYSATWDFIGFMSYNLVGSTSLFDVYCKAQYNDNLNTFLNTRYFPYRIEIDPKTRRELLTIIEDC